MACKNGLPFPNQQANIRIDNEIIFILTNGRGSFKFKVRTHLCTKKVSFKSVKYNFIEEKNEEEVSTYVTDGNYC